MAIKKYHVSRNLAQFEKGYISPTDGNESPWTDSKCPIRSQYIECIANSQYAISSNVYPFQNFVSFYDSNKEYISRSTGADVKSARAFTTPGNAAFLRVTLWHSLESQIYPSEESNLEIMVNYGSTPLPYEPYDPEIWHKISYRKYGTETESITTLPKEIITDGEPIGINLLNPDSTFIESGNAYYGGTFPAGTYYIMNNDSLYDYIEVIITELGSTEVTDMAGGASDIFTTTGTITVKIWTQNTARNVLVARSSVAVPFVPYSPCTISGNMNQNGIPISSAPIYPEECGERTGNLLDVAILQNNKGISSVGNIIDQNGRIATVTPIDVSDFSNVTLTYSADGGLFIFSKFNGNTLVDRQASKQSGYTIDVSGCDKLYICFYASNSEVAITVNDVTDIMLNSGSTALPYEPYGYKLPLTIGGTEYPIYLGQVQTTRRIKKLVLTGEENWDGRSKFRIGLSGQIGTIKPWCTHYIGSTVIGYADLSDGYITVNGATNKTLCIYDSQNQIDVQTWKSFLAQQYANGTPVTVWYTIAEPETGIVNEPIRKIGYCADTVTATNIPTTGTPENFDIGTTLKPSEVQLTYHGWHEHEDTKYMQGE